MAQGLPQPAEQIQTLQSAFADFFTALAHELFSVHFRDLSRDVSRVPLLCIAIGAFSGCTVPCSQDDGRWSVAASSPEVPLHTSIQIRVGCGGRQFT